MTHGSRWLLLLALGCSPAPAPATPNPVPTQPAAREPALAPTETLAPVPEPNGQAVPSAVEPTAGPPQVSGKKTARCTRDDECALRGTHDCCGSCLVMPIAAVSASRELQDAKRESAHCAREDHDCSKFECAPALPKGCTARAVCAQGWCMPSLSQACEG